MKNINYELEIIFKELNTKQVVNSVIPILMNNNNKINNIIDFVISKKLIDKIEVSNDISWILLGFGFKMDKTSTLFSVAANCHSKRLIWIVSKSIKFNLLKTNQS